MMVAVSFDASALTVEKITRTMGGAVCAELAYDAAAADRHVLVAWGSSDAGTSHVSWGQAEFAQGVAGAGSTKCRVTLPPNAATAAQARFFLMPPSSAPAYIRSTGKQFIKTDFYPTPKSKIVADYQWEDTKTVQQRIFGTSSGLIVQHYINGSGGLSWNYAGIQHWSAFGNDKFKADKARAVITLDAANRRVTFVKDGVQAYETAMSGQAPGTISSTLPLNILAVGIDLQGLSYKPKYGVARIYSLSCSTDGELKQNFVPHLRGGVAGLLDTVTGTFYDNELSEPFWAGAPASAVAPSETSAAVSPAVELAKFAVASFTGGGVTLTFGASSSTRELWCVWDDSDKGDSFAAWANNERVCTVAVDETTAHFSLPPGAAGASSVRFFLLAAGGTYSCAYIRGDGRQAIDTGIPTGTNMAVSVDFIPSDLGSVQQRVFGVEGVTSVPNGFALAAYINGSGQYAWAAQDHVGNWASTGVVPEQTRTTITLDVPNDFYRLVFDGREVHRKTVSSAVAAAKRTIVDGQITLALFAEKNIDGSFDNTAQIELYRATVGTNGVPARDYSPCVEAGVPGMRDSVTGDFFGNAITNGYTQFIPGGRIDAPTALAVTEAISPKSAGGGDVFADARFLFRGLAEDVDGNGVLNVGEGLGEVRDVLRRATFTDKTYGVTGHQPRFTNELVRFPGRNLARQATAIYFPQDIVVTNEAENKCASYPSTIGLTDALKGLGNRWTFLVRARPDMASPPTYNSQWLVNFGHTGKQGMMIGLKGDGRHSRTFCVYSTATDLTSLFTELYVTNGWFDLVVIADGQKLTTIVMRDGEELTGSGGDVKIGTTIKSRVLDPKHNLTPGGLLTLGAESSTSGARPYPMGANDNSVKAFRGSIQQVAVWGRALSEAEAFSAMGWPRTDLWRVGVEDGAANEFHGESAAAGVAVDAEMWPIQDGVSRTKPLTLKFPIDEKYEMLCGQVFRWKALPGSAEGRLALTLNGKSLGVKTVRPGAWSQWFVMADLLQAGTNTAVLTRVDAGNGALIPDVVALGGGVQVGGSDLGYADFVQEGTGRKHLYAADGNLHDVKRVLYCQKSSNSNFWYHVTVPSELVSPRQRWRFTIGTAGASLGDLTSHPISLDLNGKTLGTREMAPRSTYSFDIAAEDVLPGENVFNLRNSAPNTGSHYLGLDYFAFEPLRTIDGTLMLLR